MTDNFHFCNKIFLSNFYCEPGPFYNEFLIQDTKSLIDSMGNHPDCRIEFNYNPEKKIRATFISFDDASQEKDVTCICTLFHGGSSKYYCYFYELNEDSTIDCVQVVNESGTCRQVLERDVGEDLDECFDKLCSMFTDPPADSLFMLFYTEREDFFHLLDIKPSELPMRCIALLGGEPIINRQVRNGTSFLFYNSERDSSCLIARTDDGQQPIDIQWDDLSTFFDYE